MEVTQKERVKAGTATPGLAAKNTENYLRKTGKLRGSTMNTESKDTQNRKYVIKHILSSLDDGLTLEQALDKIMQDKIIENFKYLENIGGIRECFKRWTIDAINRKVKNEYKNKNDDNVR